MNFVLRQQLIAALEAFRVVSGSCITAATKTIELSDDDFKEHLPTSILFKNGTVVDIPISKKGLTLLEEIAEPVENNNSQIEQCIEGSKVAFLSPPTFSNLFISTMVEATAREEFQICPENIEAHLSHLAIRQPVKASNNHVGEGGSKENMKYYVEKGPGSFGILIVQIPVTGGYRGGEFRVRTLNHLSDSHTACPNSQRCIHITMLYDDAQVMMNPITNGSQLVLVYNLRQTSLTGFTRLLCEDYNSYVYRIRQLPRPSPIVDHFSKEKLALRNSFLAWSKLPYTGVYAIPLLYTYCKKDLCFNILKGTDYSMTQHLLNLLGDFVDIHLATITKYVGYKEEDWHERGIMATSGSEIMKKKTNGKSLEEISENDLIEYWASNWCGQDNRQLMLPPLSVHVPDHLLGCDCAFKSPPPYQGGLFGGLTFERASIILWPREKTFDASLCFGLEQSLDVAENSFDVDPNCNVAEEKKKQMDKLLAFCKKEPNKSWFANPGGPSTCDDLRCDRARPVSLQVANMRSLRLMDLCIKWKLPDSGKELVRLLFSKHERTDYRCQRCFVSGQLSLYVGGICSKEVADKLLDLFFFLGGHSTEIKGFIKLAVESIQEFDLNQTGHLAYLATCFLRRKCSEMAMFICDEAYSLLIVYLENIAVAQITDGVVGDCIKMIYEIEGHASSYKFSEESRLSKFLLQLETLSAQHSSLIIGWLQNIDATFLKSLPPFWDFYLHLVNTLELQLVDHPPSSNLSSSQLEESSAQLISFYLKLEDDEKLDSFMGRITSFEKAESRRLLAATISSQKSWSSPSPSAAESTLADLSAARVQQLVRFKYSMFKWEQPDAVLKNHPAVETFLHSRQESMVYSVFNNEEEARVFATHFFDGPKLEMGYSARVSEIIPASDGGKVSVKIVKTLEIYEWSRQQLELLENSLLSPSPSSPVTSKEDQLVEATPNLQEETSTSSGSQPVDKSSTKRSRKQAAKKPQIPPEKRSKRLAKMAGFSESESLLSTMPVPPTSPTAANSSHSPTLPVPPTLPIN